MDNGAFPHPRTTRAFAFGETHPSTMFSPLLVALPLLPAQDTDLGL